MEPTEKALVTVCEAESAIVSAYLFGSHAAGRVHRESDLDVAVLLDRTTCPTPRERFEARLRIAGELGREARQSVDLIVLDDAPPLLARAILTRGRRIFCRDAEADHSYVRTTLSRAADLEPFLRRMRAIKLSVLAR